MDRRSYFEQKIGGQAGAVKAYMPVVRYAQAAGLEINFEAIKNDTKYVKCTSRDPLEPSGRSTK